MLENNRAIGVECIDKNQQSFQLKANKEVLLSSGAFGSPQILLRSGIGPSEEIIKHGIEHIMELPGVGKNLQDHIDYLTVHKYNSIGLIGFSVKALLFKYPLEVLKYAFARTGFLLQQLLKQEALLKQEMT